MTIQEKITYSNESPSKAIHLWKEGVFWVAYEQSAYQVWKMKQYKATKKFIKAAGMDVVSIGFPHVGTFADALQAPDETQSTHRVISIDTPFVYEDFIQWKTNVPLKTTPAVSPTPANVEILRAASLREKIQNFDLSNATPMECMNFLAAIKKELARTEP